MILSTIDIGTNTILMLTLRRENGAVTVLGDEHEIARLGKGVDADREIMPETFDRVAGYLLRYREIAEGLGAETITAFGTSALRDARNRKEFIEAMRERTGLAIELLSGAEEAELTYRGALFGMALGDGTYGVIDIGGGSTEIAVGDRERPTSGKSIDIGAVRITERFLPVLPPLADQIDAARDLAREALGASPDLPADIRMVGVAGTVTTLGAMAAGLESFDADALNGTVLTREAIGRITSALLVMTVEEIRAIPQVHPDRADVLPGGAIILDEFMERHGLAKLTVSTRGVRYGVAMRKLAG
jgi:exopolyphosphatase/guanosine-5'-triphosphate,3'-diphosphate pyrophosphatase